MSLCYKINLKLTPSSTFDDDVVFIQQYQNACIKSRLDLSCDQRLQGVSKYIVTRARWSSWKWNLKAETSSFKEAHQTEERQTWPYIYNIGTSCRCARISQRSFRGQVLSLKQNTSSMGSCTSENTYLKQGNSLVAYFLIVSIAPWLLGLLLQDIRSSSFIFT